MCAVNSIMHLILAGTTVAPSNTQYYAREKKSCSVSRDWTAFDDVCKRDEDVLGSCWTVTERKSALHVEHGASLARAKHLPARRGKKAISYKSTSTEESECNNKSVIKQQKIIPSLLALHSAPRTRRRATTAAPRTRSHRPPWDYYHFNICIAKKKTLNTKYTYTDRCMRACVNIK